jgi:tetratricopeptide (TPR) repeat protein
MMTLQHKWRSLVLTASVSLAAAAPAFAQDALAEAKNDYASAKYEEALQVLTQVRRSAPAPQAVEASAYQVFCLVALGRSDEAKQAVEDIVRADPLYQPTAADVSPRVLAFFDTVRKPLLPEAARKTYAAAKDAFDRKDLPAAKAGFDRVLSLLGEMSPSAGDGAADLRTLATGFLELTKTAAPPPEPPKPAPPVQAAPAPAPVAPAAPRVYTVEDTDVTRPVALSRTLPAWSPMDNFEARQSFRGVLEVVIGEDGKVQSASVVKPVQVRYDPVLVRAAQGWTYQPATKDGKPVKFRLLMDVHVGN